MGDLALFLPLFIVLGAFMFFASRRQKKAMQATIDLHESLSIGDRVHTTSGLEATITGITADSVDLEIAPGVITTWMKLAVRDRIEPTDDDDSNDFDEDYDASDAVEELDAAPDVQPGGSTDASATPSKTDPTASPKTDS
jgi:preprotein translocase subunit YajC